MKLPVIPACCCAFSLILAPAICAQEGKDKKSLDLDKAKGALEKLAGEAKKALSKGEDKNAIWPHSKEVLVLPMNEYIKRAEMALRTIDTETKALAEADSAVASRDYFKSQLESLRQRHAYCAAEMAKLKEIGDEEAFRVKQKKFDRALVFLSDAVQLAKDEAGI